MKWTIKNKLIIGFSAIFTILMIVVLLNVVGMKKNQTLTNRVVELRTPTAEASLRILNGINQSLAGLRGWMLLKDAKFKTERKDAWRDFINAGYSEMERLSVNWTNPENVKRLNEVKANLDVFEKYQLEIENIANTNDNIPSYKILLTKAAPQALNMYENITAIIDLEANRETTVQRKAILGMMADVRGTLGLALASIRAYLLTGEEKFNNKFRELWTKNDKRFIELLANSDNLNAEQQKYFNLFVSAREEFVQYPEQMFELRSGEDWNIANYWLKTKAAPTADKITKNLNKMVKDQHRLLKEDENSLLELNKSMIRNSIILAVLGLIFAVFITIIIVNSITKPIDRLNENIKTITNGDLTKEIEISGSDELTVAALNMKAMSDKLKEIIGSVLSSSKNISDSSLKLSDTSQRLSEGSSEQASSAEEVSASMEEIDANIQQNTDNAQQTEKIALRAAEGIKGGNSASLKAVKAMQDIAQRISIISDIAFQTNILALNAAVEAARAGIHGKGFAVVATEVRKLAERSAHAASDINKFSKEGVDISNIAGEKLAEIVPEIEKTAQLISEISMASMEQRSGVEQVNTAIQQLSHVTQQNASSSEEMASSASELASQAEELKNIVSFFKINY